MLITHKSIKDNMINFKLNYVLPINVLPLLKDAIHSKLYNFVHDDTLQTAGMSHKLYL